MDTTDQALAIILVLLALVTTVIVTQFIRRRRDLFMLRPIDAYRSLPDMVGRSIEASRPLHLSVGSAGIGGQSTLLAIVSAELAYQMIQRAAIGDTPPLLTFSDASALPLAQDTLRRAYEARDNLAGYRAMNARWFPEGPRSLAFAAGVTALMADERVSANAMAGSYGPELALILDAGARRDLPSLAVSDRLEGQAVAWAMADSPLIGEEVFQAGAYLEGGASQTGAAVATDVLRWVIIVAIVIGFIAGFIENGG